MSDTEEFFAHYGIPGMRWGKRKSESSVTTSAPGKARVADSADFTRKTGLETQTRNSGVNSLSNKQLRTMMERMQLEQSYKGLEERSKPAKKDAQAEVKKILAVVGTVNSIIAVANSPAGKMVKQAFWAAAKTAVATKKGRDYAPGAQLSIGN